ncbi:hypothetical protein IQR32_11910 [Acinetobacter albensis]|uniref:hypothetical protein n=1 Tax=Acinetobacter albensis TaxID=1673609 RepID=UPI001881792C|nr:hypothetical protein [Acinetobacter albensis]MBE9402028.1 hypothetical protein [Acinetobacter albensis]
MSICYFRWGLVFIALVGMMACDSSGVVESFSQNPNKSPQSLEAEQAKTLIEIAGQATLPAMTHARKSPIKAYEKPFVGRYHAHIPCDDNFVPCTAGTAEYILNLSADGSVHRSIVQFGKVFAENTQTDSRNANYRRDTWSINLERTELVVHRKNGVNFYYDIQDPQHLIMNLDKINRENSGGDKYFFKQGYRKPLKAYVLLKD